jgi:YVTN family beta-propeller protein
MQSRLRSLPIFSAFLCLAAVFFISCSNDDNPTPALPSAQAGYFIVNEGGFGNANTTISYYDRESNSVRNNIFQDANNRPLGDQTQSMTVFDERGFIIVQNSSKIEVIDRDDFSSIATIDADDGIVSPRYFLGINSSKGYVTDWGADGISGSVKVIDLDTYEVTASISVGQGPNRLILHNDQVYVANQGGLGYDSTVVVIDPQTNTVVETIVVGDNPNSLTVDANGQMWVAGSGRVVFDPVDFSVIEEESTPGFLARLDNDEVVLKIDVDQLSSGPRSIATSLTGQTLHFLYASDVYQMGISDTEFPTSPLIDGQFYGLSVDPISGEIVTSQAPNFSDDGTFSRYSSSGELVESYTVGIAPNGFAF